MDTGSLAAAEAARRRVNRAAGHLRDAARDLARLTNGELDVLGVLTVHDADSAQSVSDLVSLERGRHGAVDVVVLARPTGRRGSSPTTAPTGAKENPHGNGSGAGRGRGTATVGQG